MELIDLVSSVLSSILLRLLFFRHRPLTIILTVLIFNIHFAFWSQNLICSGLLSIWKFWSYCCRSFRWRSIKFRMICFRIISEMFHENIFVNLVLLLLLLNFLNTPGLVLMYISFIMNIRSNIIHLHGFQPLIKESITS